MSIKSHYEIAIQNLESEKAKQMAAKKEQVMREKIIPYNQEMDKLRDNAIAELQQNLNQDIVERQNKFSKEKQAIIEENEKRKEANQATVITTETYTVSAEYDKAISNLKKLAEELE